jgi:hypothetical protein
LLKLYSKKSDSLQYDKQICIICHATTDRYSSK